MCWHPFFVALACQGKVGILNALKQKADSGCRQPRCIQRDIRYCRNLIWIIPAEGSGVGLPKSRLREQKAEAAILQSGVRPFVCLRWRRGVCNLRSYWYRTLLKAIAMGDKRVRHWKAL